MPKGTTMVNTELRAKLYELAAKPHRPLYIPYDTVAGPNIHFLRIVSDLIKVEDDGWHLETVLDDKGLRFKREMDV